MQTCQREADAVPAVCVPAVPEAGGDQGFAGASVKDRNDFPTTGGEEPGGKGDGTRSALSGPHPV